MLGEVRTVGSWDYRTLPNKTLELVKNTGDMHQEGTGYYTDSESEMLLVLGYLNYGELTGTTEGMREQIDDAVRRLQSLSLRDREEEEASFVNINI